MYARLVVINRWLEWGRRLVARIDRAEKSLRDVNETRDSCAGWKQKRGGAPPRGRGAPVRRPALSGPPQNRIAFKRVTFNRRKYVFLFSATLWVARAFYGNFLLSALSSRSHVLSFRAKMTAMMTRFYSWTRSTLHFCTDLPLNFIVFDTDRCPSIDADRCFYTSATIYAIAFTD